MITITRFNPPGYMIVTPQEPFAFEDLVIRGIQDAAALGDEQVFGTPFLLDFRQINLLQFIADDFQKAISLRYRATHDFRNVPCALVASDESNFGMLRMYSTYMDIRQLRDDASVFLTTDFAVAHSWIERVAKERVPELRA